MGCLGSPVLKNLVKTRVFGGPFIHFGDFLMVTAHLYENGAILGRARRNKMAILAKLFPVDPGKEANFIDLLQDLSHKRLEEYKREFEKEPKSFFELFCVLSLRESGINLSATDSKTVERALREKMNMYDTEPLIKDFGLEGIGFGSLFPELTEKLYRNHRESIDMGVWSEARTYGLVLPEEPTVVSLCEQEETVLQTVAIYTSEYYPELVDPLDLRGFLE